MEELLPLRASVQPACYAGVNYSSTVSRTDYYLYDMPLDCEIRCVQMKPEDF
jgi:hypothetical protein